MAINSENPAGPAKPAKSILKPNTGAGATLQPSQAPANAPKGPTAWQNATSTNALKSALHTARNPTLGPRQKSVMMAPQATPSGVASQMGRMNMNGQEPEWRARGSYDPSMGPRRSDMTTRPRPSVAAGNATGRTRRTDRQHFQNAVCKLGNMSRSDFRLGDVIAAPFHTANTNPHASPEDPRLVRTVEGHAYSKRRMSFVLFIYSQDLYCLPLYNFSSRGISAKPDELKREYVCMRNFGDEGFKNQGKHKPVVIKARYPMTEATTVHLTGGVRIGCNEDISSVGRLTQESYTELVDLWSGLVEEAQDEGW